MPASSTAPSEPDLRAYLRRVVADAIGPVVGRPPDEISEAEELIADLGIDSMHIANLVVDVEGRLGLELADGFETKLVGARTVGDLVELFATTAATPATHPDRKS